MVHVHLLYNWLLVKLMLKGVVFLFFSLDMHFKAGVWDVGG